MLLEARGLWKRVDGFELADVSLELRGGEIALLLGPNGSGKTMLCRLLCLILRPDRGEILLDGVDVQDIEEEYKGMLSYVAEDEGYPFWLTLEEYLRFFASLRGLDWDEVRGRAEELCRGLRLMECWDRRLSEFSAGMLRKASLVRALIGGKIFILDEPFVNLDKEAVRFVCGLLARLRSEGKMILVTSHLMPPYIAPDKVYVMAGGRIKAAFKGAEASGLREIILRFKYPADAAQGWLAEKFGDLLVVERLEPNVLRILARAESALELLGSVKQLKEDFGLLDVEVRRFYKL